MALEHKEKRVLPYTPEQLFDLVIDIESYPEFLPWCLRADILSKRKNEMTAEVIIGYKIFRERFTSRVTFSRPGKISVEYMKGPLSHLHNEWTFKPKGKTKCEVGFEVGFELHSRILQGLMEQFFHIAIARMVTAFEQRARELYGE